MPGSEPSARGSRWPAAGPLAPALASFALAMGVRAAFIVRYPVLYWSDGYQRLAHVEDLVQVTWLPLYQATLAALAPFTRDPTVFRLWTSFHGALGAAAAAWLWTRSRGPIPGALAGAFVALCPLYVVESVGLYPEPLFTALCLGALALLAGATRRAAAGGVALLAAAELTRYEGWLLALLAAAWIGAGGPLPGRGAPSPFRSVAARVAAVAGLAAVPGAWIAVHRGLTPMGSASLSPGFGWERTLEQAGIMSRLAPHWGGWPWLVLAALGLPGFLRRPLRDRGVTLALAAWSALFFVSLVATQPFWPRDSMRVIHIPLLLVLALALGGVEAAWRRLAAPTFRGPAAVLGWAGGAVLLVALAAPLGRAEGFLAEAARGRESRVPAAVGARLRGAVDGARRVLVVSEGFREWPGEEPPACKAVVVAVERPHRDVVCDTEAPAGAARDARSLRSWLAREGVAHVVVFDGFEPWRPLQRTIVAEAAREGGALEPAGAVEGARIYAVNPP